MGFVIAISPAKKMNVVDEEPAPRDLPRFIGRTEELMRAVQGLSYDEAKAPWACSDKLAQLNYERFAHMDLRHGLTAACVAYEGIQYQHLAPRVMAASELAYLDAHLRILSGFYGVLRPFDGVVPYRLEMQARLAVGGARDLYAYWGDALARALASEADTLVNLASVEYAKAVLPWTEAAGLRVVTCLFGQMVSGKYVQRSTEAKAARGTFVRWCAERGVESVADLASFDERLYALDAERSDERTLVFVKQARE